MEPSIFLLLIFIIIIVIVFFNFYWRLHEHPKFESLVSFFVMFNTLLMIFTIYITTDSHKYSNSNSRANQHNDCCKKIFGDFFEFFICNPTMCYFFDEIYNCSSTNEKRNEIMEQLCCCQLMTNMTNYCTHYYKYINCSQYKFFLIRNNKKFIKFFTLLLKNSRVKKYVLNYLDKSASKYIIDYFAEFFP